MRKITRPNRLFSKCCAFATEHMQSSRTNPEECFDITIKWTESGPNTENAQNAQNALQSYAKPIGIAHLLHSPSCPARRFCLGQNRSEKLPSKTAYYSPSHRLLAVFGFIPLGYFLTFLTFESTCSALSRKKVFCLSPYDQRVATQASHPRNHQSAAFP